MIAKYPLYEVKVIVNRKVVTLFTAAVPILFV